MGRLYRSPDLLPLEGSDVWQVEGKEGEESWRSFANTFTGVYLGFLQWRARVPLLPAHWGADLERTLAIIYPNPFPNSADRPREVSWLIQGCTASKGRNFHGLYPTLPSLSSGVLFTVPPLMSGLCHLSPLPHFLPPVPCCPRCLSRQVVAFRKTRIP